MKMNGRADALLLQYYEEPDAVRAAFGHELTDGDWASWRMPTPSPTRRN